VKITAFPFQKYGMLNGTVRTISADALQLVSRGRQDDDLDTEGAGKSPFKALIKLDSQRLSRGESDWLLVPGMEAVVEVREGERTLIEYLISPIKKAFSEAARER
jgi:HlyD family secretion protein